MGALRYEKLGRVSTSGKLNLPAQHRKLLGLEHGGPVRIGIVDGEIRIRTVESVMRDLGREAKKLLKGDSVERFLVDRRADAQREISEE